MNVTASFGWPLPRREPQPEPPPNRPDEFWWVETCEGMPLEPACISFRGDEPYGILEIGSDYEQPLSRRQVRLVERVAPAGSATDVETLWQELRSATDTIVRQAATLTEVVNALRGPPPEGTQWSHHDAGELAREAKRKLERTLRDIEISYAMERGDDDTVDRLTRQAITPDGTA